MKLHQAMQQPQDPFQEWARAPSATVSQAAKETCMHACATVVRFFWM